MSAPGGMWGIIVAAALLAGATGAPPIAQAQDAPAQAPVMDFTGLGPAPLEDPRALYEWGRRAKEMQGCTLAESAWIRILAEDPTSEWAPPALYSLAVCAEDNGELDQSLALYQRFIDEYASDPLIKDATFREGLVLEAQGSYRAALKVYKGMLRHTELRLSVADRDAVTIQRDIELLYMGRERKAVDRLLGHLAQHEAKDRDAQEPLNYWIAKIHVVLGQALSAHGKQTPVYLTGVKRLRAALPGGKDEATLLKEQLDARARDLLAAQGQYQAAIDMGIPEWSLAAVYHMGRDHEDLYRDLLAAPVPGKLSPGDAEIYRHEVMDRSHPILVKAYRLYHHGAELARTWRDDSRWARLLAERTAALEREGISVDDLDIAPSP